jgi:hypothetical protein
MNEFGTFYNPSEINIQRIIEPYQEAFARPPWNEVSKCADESLPQRCAGGLSRIAIGSICGTCETKPSRQAYAAEELIERFKTLEQTRPLSWYTEESNGNVATASLAWTATAKIIAREKYSDNPDMQPWLENILGDNEIVWLDEVFANKAVRATNNLTNFKAMCDGFLERFDNTTLAYRTISPAMTRVALRDFGVTPLQDTPDRRSFIVIDAGKRQA